MSNVIQKATIGMLALLMVVFGLNKFFGFIAVDPPADPVAQQFMGAMFTTYLFKVVAIAEIVGGTLLIVPRTTLIGWILLLPVVFNIVAFHVAHDFVGNGIWLLPTALFIAIGVILRDRLVSLFLAPQATALG